MSSTKPRARALRIPFDGKSGKHNAITDVKGVCVGHRHHSDSLNINTGVTAILPLGNVGNGGPLKDTSGPGNGIDTFVLAAWFSVNGDGEMTGTTNVEESGFLEGPILLTNTASVGTVHNAVIKYSMNQQVKPIEPDNFGIYLPVVAETYDGYLNDILGFHVTPQMVYDAIDNAKGGDVEEGNVGGGTGMTCYSWKGGIGTSSRKVVVYGVQDTPKPIKNPNGNKDFTVGVLVQANQGTYWDLVIRGVPVGRDRDFAAPPDSPDFPPGTSTRSKRARKSSIIVVIATDAPLLPNQLKRLARRATHGIARTGTITNEDSGEIFIAFSTANLDASDENRVAPVGMIPNDSMDPLFEATVQATEEAIINALVVAKTLVGRGGCNAAYAITDMPPPYSPSSLSLVEVMKKYNRLRPE